MSSKLTLHPLARADGSAAFSTDLFAVLAAVNGPIEVQRRDELPEEAAIEVNIRPSSGVGGPRERWLESVIASLLKSVLLVHIHPRTLMQITLQVTQQPSMKMRRRNWDVAIIPALANAAFLALVDGGLPLGKTMSAALGVVQGPQKAVVLDPNEKQLAACESVHAMVFTAQGDMLLNESAGAFSLEQWQEVFDALKMSATATMAAKGEDDAMTNGTAESRPWLREALEADVRQAGLWREGG